MRTGSIHPAGTIFAIGLAAAVLSWGGVVSPCAAADPVRPNIVLVMADDLGFSDLGCYGSEIETPNLDRLAANGLRFTQFYNCAVCVTTRAALLTGLHPRHGRATLLHRDMVTLGEALHAVGYQTSLTGKWHLGTGPDEHPARRGFQEFYGLGDGGSNHFSPAIPDPVFYNGSKLRSFFHNLERVREFPADFYSTDVFAAHAAGTIRKYAQAGRPFFVHVCFTAPHVPLHAPPDDIAKYRGRYDDGYFVLREKRYARQLEFGIIDRRWTLAPVDRKIGAWKYDYEVTPWDKVADLEREKRRMEVYAAMVHRLDRGMGTVLAALEEAGAAENTIVLFLSDNGGCAALPADEQGWRKFNDGKLPGPKDTYDFCGPGWGWAQSAPFRRYKTWTYEGGLATPLIVRWPKKVRAGTITHEVGHVIDLMPTLLELAGGTYPRRFGEHAILPAEGRSLAAVFRGGRWDMPRTLAWYLYGGRALRDGKWKLVYGVSRRQWELYDMEADRTETHDLAGAEPERVVRMADAWHRWATTVELKSSGREQ